ncbi:MAG: hypothetical protein WAK90_19160 [Pseudolabrys sp.]
MRRSHVFHFRSQRRHDRTPDIALFLLGGERKAIATLEGVDEWSVAPKRQWSHVALPVSMGPAMPHPRIDLDQRLLSQKPRQSMRQENLFLKTWEVRMIRLIAFAAFAFAVTTSVQATPLAPIKEPDSMITQVVAGCGMGMTRVNGVCVSRHAKRVARRCARWNGSTCAKYY